MKYIPYAYYLRAPLVLAILLLLLPVTGLWLDSPVQSIIRGMFDLTPWGALTVSLCTLLFGGTLSVQTCLILLYGRMRFFAAKLDEEDVEDGFTIGPLGVPRVAIPFLIYYAICCGAMLAGVIAGSEPEGRWPRAGAVAGALAIFAITVYVLALLWASLGSESTEFIARRLKWTPWGFLKLRDASDTPHIATAEATPQRWPFHEPAQLLPGHGFAVLLLLVSTLFYAAFALSQWKILDAVERHETPSGLLLTLPVLASVVILFALLLWTLGLLAFLFDRYRIPIFVPLAAVFLFSAQFTQSDHYFDVQPLKDSTQYPPGQALQPTTQGLANSAIIVTLSGGGIKAAAWATQVLGGLVGAMPASFAPSIRLISSVSGGSVGALYFVHAYKDGAITPQDAQSAITASMASSLGEVGWGLVYPDMWRAVMPILLSPRIDRGWALETAFLREVKSIRDGDWPTLGSWRADARLGKRPAVIFNTTAVESGERFLFPTVDLTPAVGRQSFHDLEDHGALDLRANTAARLSATFPYVTPVSRANFCGPRNQRFHFADGGYYDNFGIASATEFLRQAIPTGTTSPVSRILIIQVMLDTPGEPTASGSRGWFFQSFAPVETLLKMRDAAQFSRNQAEVALLKDVLCFQKVQVELVQFPYPKLDRNDVAPGERVTDPPVSWHMTQSDKNDVRASWNHYLHEGGQLAQIRAFLNNQGAASCK